MALKTMEAVRSNVKRLRQIRGWTQRELAERAGVHREEIARLEGNPKNFPHGPTLFAIERLADALEVDVQDLLA